ncbi:MAG: hypothetical protein F4Z15_02455 [Gammaproteobacteria bacterium]|nr:hypothetical protein [Gammaproteobacteria bacterium]MYD76910.1 hypothetical protein [Gammaproteobacteria bacterium]MYJ52880.1 hypothetical protein [Gammaproteobacteria bacterium]
MNAAIRYFVGSQPLPLCMLMVTPYGVYKLTEFGSNHPIEWAMLVVVFLCSMLGWIYSICHESDRRLDSEFRLSPIRVNLMRIAFILPFVCLGIYVKVVLIPLYLGVLKELPGWMIYVHFTALGSIAFAIWTSSTQLMTLKLGRKTIFLDIYGTVFAMWFCFVGVWFIQKTVTRELAT